MATTGEDAIADIDNVGLLDVFRVEISELEATGSRYD
jgi:hypothetical protein